MKSESLHKYRPFHPKFRIDLSDRCWPDRVIESAPVWCSVDLRDGNQALAIPMNVDEKMAFFGLLCGIGFREIEVGFPSASDTEFRFLRRLVDEGAIPCGVAVQVLVQAREHLIRRTFESLDGVPEAIVHIYNSTSPLQRRVTFGGADKGAIKRIATDAVRLARELAPRVGDTKVRLQYSPESFSDTEVDYALEVCEAVLDTWGATAGDPVILNLPATVEWTTPNVHADQIEWFCRNLRDRERAIVSLHTHNDRGTGIAATELGLLAGAQRVEGTLFGNGERTGNLDIVTVALNMNSHGIETGLDFSNLPEIRAQYERFTRMSVHERQPYGGELVFTAFSGSHQDAIKKGMDRIRKVEAEGGTTPFWEVPYLTIDPQDIGRSYEAIIRINSQSGKGGVAWVIDREYGVDLPASLRPAVGLHIGAIADRLGRELSAGEIWEAFCGEYVNRNETLQLVRHKGEVEEIKAGSGEGGQGNTVHEFDIVCHGGRKTVRGQGNGPINALAHALESEGLKDFRVTDYRSQAIGSGSAADAAAFVEISKEDGGGKVWGCGIDPSIEMAGLLAVVSAINRAQGGKE